MMELKQNTSNRRDEPLRVTILGVGGAGLNAVDRLMLDGVEHAIVAVANTDLQALTSSVVTQKIQLGRSVTRGLGAGGDPELGVAAAEEAEEPIREALKDAQLVFVCAGLGGGTGSGAAPFIARLARDAGALVLAVATMPFSFEGRRRMQQAEESLAALQRIADVVICFENDRMAEAISPKAGIHEAFASADQTISQSVRAICDMIGRPGLVRVGFDDVSAALRNINARALFGFGVGEGENKAHEALERALKNPLMERGRLLEESHDLLVNVRGGSDMTLAEVQVLMEALNRYVGEDTRILFGVGVDGKMAGRMSLTLLSSRSLGQGTPAARPEPQRKSEATYVEPQPEPERLEIEPEIEQPEEAAESVAQVEHVEPEPTEEQRLEFSAPQEEQQEPEVKELLDDEPEQPLPVASQDPEEDAQAAPRKKKPKQPQEEQATLPFESHSRGRFEKSEPTIIDGEDLDVPTFLRRNVRVK